MKWNKNQHNTNCPLNLPTYHLHLFASFFASIRFWLFSHFIERMRCIAFIVLSDKLVIYLVGLMCMFIMRFDWWISSMYVYGCVLRYISSACNMTSCDENNVTIWRIQRLVTSKNDCREREKKKQRTQQRSYEDMRCWWHVYFQSKFSYHSLSCHTRKHTHTYPQYPHEYAIKSSACSTHTAQYSKHPCIMIYIWALASEISISWRRAQQRRDDSGAKDARNIRSEDKNRNTSMVNMKLWNCERAKRGEDRFREHIRSKQLK